jgi:GNAT superfamily N-acetyltransferase
MTNIDIRPATTEDLKSLCQLYVEFHEFHVQGVPDRLKSLGDPKWRDDTELRKNIKKVIADHDSTIFLAQIGRQPVGLAEVYIREDQANPQRVSRRHGHLQSLITAEKFRRQGVGNKLLEAAERWAREKGAVEMRLDIWEFPEGPLEFYEKCGYRTLRRSMVRELGPQNDRGGTNEV